MLHKKNLLQWFFTCKATSFYMVFILVNNFSLPFSIFFCKILIFTYIYNIFCAGSVISFTRTQIQFGNCVNNLLVTNTSSRLPLSSLEKRRDMIRVLCCRALCQALACNMHSIEGIQQQQRYFFLYIKTIFIYLLAAKCESLKGLCVTLGLLVG